MHAFVKSTVFNLLLLCIWGQVHAIALHCWLRLSDLYGKHFHPLSHLSSPTSILNTLSMASYEGKHMIGGDLL